MTRPNLFSFIFFLLMINGNNECPQYGIKLAGPFRFDITGAECSCCHCWLSVVGVVIFVVVLVVVVVVIVVVVICKSKVNPSPRPKTGS